MKNSFTLMVLLFTTLFFSCEKTDPIEITTPPASGVNLTLYEIDWTFDKSSFLKDSIYLKGYPDFTYSRHIEMDLSGIANFNNAEVKFTGTLMQKQETRRGKGYTEAYITICEVENGSCMELNYNNPDAVSDALSIKDILFKINGPFTIEKATGRFASTENSSIDLNYLLILYPDFDAAKLNLKGNLYY